MLRFLLALLVAGALFPGAVHANAANIHNFELDNGMTILVKPDTRAPVVISQIWFPVGGSHEPSGLTGVSHALEHMMFKGTETRETGSFSRIITEAGGRLNAFTGQDYTAYYEELRADRLPIALELEADRLANIVFDPDEFAREMEVVREERRLRVDDNPAGVLRERFSAVAWHHSPYRQPIIGWQQDIDQMTLDDLRGWYRDWYGINNATLVVVGDVEPEAVRDLAAEHFGPLEPRAVPERKERGPIEPLGERRLTVHHPNGSPLVMMGYHAPSLATAGDPADAYALSVLAQVLDGGQSARLPSELVRGREIAAGVGAYYRSIARLDTQLLIQARPANDAALEELEQAIRDQIRRLREDGITEEELERAKVQLRAEYVYRLDSLSGQATEIGMLETTGIGHEAMNDFQERLEAVTREHVQAMAQQYLTDDRLTVGHLRPDREAPRAPRSPVPSASPATGDPAAPAPATEE